MNNKERLEQFRQIEYILKDYDFSKYKIKVDDEFYINFCDDDVYLKVKLLIERIRSLEKSNEQAENYIANKEITIEDLEAALKDETKYSNKLKEQLKSPYLAKCVFDSHCQQYECQVTKNGISFDGCLWTELNILWLQGIKTIGSCCGRHCNSPKNTAYIQVIKEDEQKMINLGYKPIENQYGNVIFKPKTIFLESEA